MAKITSTSRLVTFTSGNRTIKYLPWSKEMKWDEVYHFAWEHHLINDYNITALWPGIKTMRQYFDQWCEEYNLPRVKVKMFKRKQGDLHGCYRMLSRTIFLTPGKLNPWTAIHEFAHHVFFSKIHSKKRLGVHGETFVGLLLFFLAKFPGINMEKVRARMPYYYQKGRRFTDRQLKSDCIVIT